MCLSRDRLVVDITAYSPLLVATVVARYYCCRLLQYFWWRVDRLSFKVQPIDHSKRPWCQRCSTYGAAAVEGDGDPLNNEVFWRPSNRASGFVYRQVPATDRSRVFLRATHDTLVFIAPDVADKRGGIKRANHQPTVGIEYADKRKKKCCPRSLGPPLFFPVLSLISCAL